MLVSVQSKEMPIEPLKVMICVDCEKVVRINRYQIKKNRLYQCCVCRGVQGKDE